MKKRYELSFPIGQQLFGLQWLVDNRWKYFADGRNGKNIHPLRRFCHLSKF